MKKNVQKQIAERARSVKRKFRNTLAGK